MPSLLPGHYAAVKVRKELYVTASQRAARQASGHSSDAVKPHAKHFSPIGELLKRGPRVRAPGKAMCEVARAYSSVVSSTAASSTGSTLVTVVSALAPFTGSVTSSMMTTSAASPLRGPSFMMRV